MREVQIAINSFNIDEFIRETFNFLATILLDAADPSFTVAWVDDNEPNYGPEDERRDHAAELLEDRKTLFFPFSASNVGEPVPCADGEEYLPADWLGDDDTVGWADEEEETGFSFGETECLGYLISVENKRYVINSAVHSSGTGLRGPYVERVADCGIFDDPMLEFIDRFVVD